MNDQGVLHINSLGSIGVCTGNVVMSLINKWHSVFTILRGGRLVKLVGLEYYIHLINYSCCFYWEAAF